MRVCYGTLGITILTRDLSTAPRNQLRERHQGRLEPDSGRASVLASRPRVRLLKVWALFQEHGGFLHSHVERCMREVYHAISSFCNSLAYMVFVIRDFILCTGTYIDKKCPFTGNVSIRGRILTGTVNCAKMTRTITIRRDYLHFVPKYQRLVYFFL